MDHLEFLKEQIHGKNIDEIKKYFSDEFNCKVNVNTPLFCPMYHIVKTKFNKKGALATRGTVFFTV